MKVKVNTDQCIGCGACIAINPENFDFNDEGLSVLKNENGSESSIEASEACPVSAIEIINECNCKNGDECNCGDDCQCGDECNCHEEEDGCCCGHCDCK